MKKLDNRGFTLVELLAVVAIIVIIMAIAIPNISSSIERSNEKKDKAMVKVIKSAGELYVSKHKAAINVPCYIDTKDDLIGENYLSYDELDGYVDSCLEYNGSSFVYKDSSCSGNKCVSD